MTVEHVDGHVSDAGEQFHDGRYFPVVVSTWLGEIDPQSISRFYAWTDTVLDRAERADTSFVLVLDALELRRPSGSIRRRFQQESNARIDRLERRQAGTVVATRNPVVLGVVSAISWMIRGGVRVTSAGSNEAAIERALGVLERAGVPRPDGLDPRGYTRPVWSGSRAV